MVFIVELNGYRDEFCSWNNKYTSTRANHFKGWDAKPESKAVTTNMTQKESVCLQNVVLKIIGHQ